MYWRGGISHRSSWRWLMPSSAIACHRQPSPAIASHRLPSPAIVSHRQPSPAIASHRQPSPERKFPAYSNIAVVSMEEFDNRGGSHSAIVAQRTREFENPRSELGNLRILAPNSRVRQSSPSELASSAILVQRRYNLAQRTCEFGNPRSANSRVRQSSPSEPASSAILVQRTREFVKSSNPNFVTSATSAYMCLYIRA